MIKRNKKMNYYITKNNKVIGEFVGTDTEVIKAVERQFKIKGKYEIIDYGYEILIIKGKNVYDIHKK